MIINNTMLILNPFIGLIVEYGKIINIVDRVDKVYKVYRWEFCRKNSVDPNHWDAQWCA